MISVLNTVSAIFYHSKQQKESAEKSKVKFEQKGIFKDPIVTEIIPFTNFYEADNYHKNYYEINKNAPYCISVIDPKIHKLLKDFDKDIKEEYRIK